MSFNPFAMDAAEDTATIAKPAQPATNKASASTDARAARFNPFASSVVPSTALKTQKSSSSSKTSSTTASKTPSRRQSSSSNPFAADDDQAVLAPEPSVPAVFEEKVPVPQAPEPSASTEKEPEESVGSQRDVQSSSYGDDTPELLTSVPGLAGMITADVIANVNPDEPSTLKATDIIRVVGSNLQDDDDDSDTEEGADVPGDRRRATVSNKARATATGVSEGEVGLLGVHASTLRRTYTLSNRAQLELMNKVKQEKMSVAEALKWAEEKEEEEAIPVLPNDEQINLLMKVKEGKLSQGDALKTMQQFREQQKLQEVEREAQETEGQTEDILMQLGSLRVPDADSASIDSFEAAISAGGQLLSNPGLLEEEQEPNDSTQQPATLAGGGLSRF